jgi:hypothetical protein
MSYTTDDTSSQAIDYQWTTGNLILDPGVFAYDLPRMCHRGLCGVGTTPDSRGNTMLVVGGAIIGGFLLAAVLGR